MLVALDAAGGYPAWRSEEGISDRSVLWLSEKYDVLLATGLTGITAYFAFHHPPPEPGFAIVSLALYHSKTAWFNSG